MVSERDRYSTGRLTARPRENIENGEVATGIQSLGLANERDGLLYVPREYDNKRPAALAVMLHGAGAHAKQGISLLQRYADEYNIIIIAPASRTSSWDIISDDAFGPDIIFIDQALELVFETYAVNQEHIAVGGFSDGASYSLSLGLTNGDLFTHIIAFSPGFAYTLEMRGKPAVFISHGIHDAVLPIDPCGRRIAPQLKHQGLEVNYKEFDGGHEVPADISKSAVEWFLKGDTSSR